MVSHAQLVPCRDFQLPRDASLPRSIFHSDQSDRGSRRIGALGAWSPYTHENTFLAWARIVDCGDAPLTFLDNTVALQQLGKAHKVVSGRTANATKVAAVPRIITLGGDHTTTLAALRSTVDHWGPVSVIHFDSHIDTWGRSELSHHGSREAPW